MHKHFLLAALAASLGLFLGVRAVQGGRIDDPNEHRLGLGKLHKESISRIEISRGAELTVLQNTDPRRKDAYHARPTFSDSIDLSGWLLNGTAAKLDRARVNALLAAVVGLRFEVEIPPELVQPDASLYGLHAPQGTLAVFTPDFNETITFGKRHAGGRTRYAALASFNGVVLIPESFYAAVNVGADDLRAKE